MIKVLISAYACSPGMGSEPGMAWNWCIHLAKYCELHIITEGEFQAQIENAVSKLPQGNRMHFYYNQVPQYVSDMCWNQGDWRFYKHYKRWQYSTYQIASSIIKAHSIDVLHQLNMIGFREPGYLWLLKDLPFVWGPVDAKESFPVAYLQGAGMKDKLFVHVKNTITKLQLKFSRRVRQAALRASVVVAASSNSKHTFKHYFAVDAPLINETGCFIKELPIRNNNDRDVLDVLWVGKLDFRKQLGLAIRSIAKANNCNIRLHIVGAGSIQKYKILASELGVELQCVWHGTISHGEVQVLMQQSDLLFFTSVAEGTPHVVLEAIANNLPVLCFDTCGQGDAVDGSVGVKIPLTTVPQSVIEFASLLNHFATHREELFKLSKNCIQRQRDLSWEEKVLQMLSFYQSALRH